MIVIVRIPAAIERGQHGRTERGRNGAAEQLLRLARRQAAVVLGGEARRAAVDQAGGAEGRAGEDIAAAIEIDAAERGIGLSARILHPDDRVALLALLLAARLATIPAVGPLDAQLALRLATALLAIDPRFLAFGGPGLLALGALGLAALSALGLAAAIAFDALRLRGRAPAALVAAIIALGRLSKEGCGQCQRRDAGDQDASHEMFLFRNSQPAATRCVPLCRKQWRISAKTVPIVCPWQGGARRAASAAPR